MIELARELGDGRITAWNRAMVDMTGVPAEEMIGRGDHAYAVPFSRTCRTRYGLR